MPEYIHKPLSDAAPESPTGLKTTWSCVYFGAYPSAEVVDDSWNAVDDYALQEGDVIRDGALYERLAQAEWKDDIAELDGVNYYRAVPEQQTDSDDIREQHYDRMNSAADHYFKIEPIRWRVLDMQDGKALLLADRIPDSAPFHAADEDVSWAESTLRSWLNGYGAAENRQGIDYSGNGFIDRAFTDAEREAILPTLQENLPNSIYGTNSGPATEDRLFILSNEDVFGDKIAFSHGFDYTKDHDDPAKRFTSTLYAKYMGAHLHPWGRDAG